MTFKEFIDRVTPRLEGSKYKLAIESEHYVYYEADNAALTFSYDEFEGQLYIRAGFKNDQIELDRKILFEVFNCEYALDSGVAWAFLTLISEASNPLLEVNEDVLKKLSDFKLKGSKLYTENLIEGQIRNRMAEKWEQKEYGEFLSIMSQLPKNALTPLDLKRREIAITKANA